MPFKHSSDSFCRKTLLVAHRHNAQFPAILLLELIKLCTTRILLFDLLLEFRMNCLLHMVSPERAFNEIWTFSILIEASLQDNIFLPEECLLNGNLHVVKRSETFKSH